MPNPFDSDPIKKPDQTAEEKISSSSKQHPGKKRLPSWLTDSVFWGMLKRYFGNDVGTRAAALAYYMVFSLFPLLILAVLFISRIPISASSIRTILRPLLPADLITLLENYFFYVQRSYDQTLVNFALVFSVYFPWRAVRGLMKDVRISHGLAPAPFSLRYLAKELVCTLILPLAMLVTLLMFVFGQNVLTFILDLLPPHTFHFSFMSLDLWDIMRFLIAAGIMGFSLGMVYWLSLDRRRSWKEVWPGIACSIVVWILASIAFSYYVEHFGDYPAIYGALGAFVILLLWLYLTAVIFIMGSEFNALLLERKAARQKNKKTQ